jgi:hypothetical protein
MRVQLVGKILRRLPLKMESDVRVHEELGVIKGQLASLPAVIAQAIGPALEKQKQEIIDEVAERMAHCREIQQPKLDALEQRANDAKADMERMKAKQTRVSIAIGVLILAFVGSFSGEALSESILPVIKHLFG